MNVHERAFCLLLRLFPSRFRDEYGEEMSHFFVQRLARARATGRRAAIVRFWFRTVADLLGTATSERRSAIERADPSREEAPMASLLHDLRYAARRLRKSPVFAISAIVMLAIGIGLNATVFSLADASLFRPAPFANPEELVHIYQDSDEGDPNSTSYPAYRDIAETEGIFAGVAASSPAQVNWERGESSTPVSIEFATASYFPVLGLRPSRGRWFSPEHDRVGSEMVAVVSDRAWRTRMGADPDVVGRTIRINNQPVTIIGVGPEDFNGDAGALIVDFWLSISSTPVNGRFQVANLDRREDHWYQVKARLAPGVTVDRAQEAMTILARRHAELYPELDEGRDITVFAFDDIRFHPDVDEGVTMASMMLLGVAGLVLLLACTNLANMLLVRGISRGPEMAVRAALGAGRDRVVRLLVLEAMLLAMLGGIAGLIAAAYAVRLIPLLPLPVPGGGLDIAFDERVIVFGLGVSLVTGLIFGLIPAFRATRYDVAAVLRDEGAGRSAGRRVSLLRGGLVAAQVALSMVLVVGAGLLARSFANAKRADVGVDAGRIAVLRTDLQQGGVTDDEMRPVMQQILARIEALPGVERAAITTRLPVEGRGTTTQIVEGYDPPTGTGSVELPWVSVSDGYFETMGIPLLAGRAFTDYDRVGAPGVRLVNEAAARRYWGDPERAIGGRIRPQGVADAWREVVGVVGDVKVSSIQESATPMMYLPVAQTGATAFAIVARTSGDPATLAGAMRRAMHEVRPSLPVIRLTSLEAHLGDTLAGLRLAAALLGGFSLMALLLASLGVYAVVSFAVERRTQELGIRMALGATKSKVVGMIVAESLVVVAIGLGVGIWLATMASRGLEGMLFGVGTVDSLTFASAAVLLLAAGALAAFVPARRAAGMDPVEVLRRQ